MSFNKTMLSGKRILITGAARGLGRCCALSCAELGAEVIAVDLSEDELSKLVKESSGTIEPWVGDVTSESLADRIRQLDRLDGLINNAGTNRVGPMEDQSSENIDLVINLNISALYRVSQAAIPALKRAGGGSRHRYQYRLVRRSEAFRRG